MADATEMVVMAIEIRRMDWRDKQQAQERSEILTFQ
jgi:hypothetical protein